MKIDNLITKLLKDLEEIQYKQDKEVLNYMKHYYEGKKSYVSELLCYLGYEMEDL